MQTSPSPSNVIDTLEKTIAEQAEEIATRDEMIAAREEMVALRDEEIALLREKVRLLQAKHFGSSSEKSAQLLGQDQLPLFEIDEPEEEPREDEDSDETEEVRFQRKKKPGRKPIPDHLPRFEVVHDLEEADKICGCGCRMRKIREVVTEELDYIPAKAKVLRHTRYVYACGVCEGSESPEPAIQIAPAPPRMLPGSMAAPGLLAFAMTAKFVDGLPFYRLEQQTKRHGFTLSRATLSNWARSLGTKLKPLWDRLLTEAKNRPWLQVDETTVQVLGEPGRANTSRSYMWVIRAGPVEKPIILYRYDPSRGSSVAATLLDGYQGIVQTDGYKGYDFLASKEGVRHAGDWDHVRRRFVEAIQAKPKGKKGRKPGHAERIVKTIRSLYRIETEAREEGLDAECTRALRQEHAKPLILELERQLRDLKPKAPEQSLLGKAIVYALGQWPKLTVYLDNGLLPMSTAYVENAIRPFVIGRKAWLFSGSPRGAHASAVLFSLVETAKASGWEPYAYLDWLFRRFPAAETEEDIEALLPTNPPVASLPTQ